jgi:hypothetical protein
MIIETALIDALMEDLEDRGVDLKGHPLQEEAKTLAKILERIKPMLEIAAYEIKRGCFLSGKRSAKPEWSYFDDLGLVLIDNFSELYSGSGSMGDFSGSRLILFRNGRLVHVSRAGKWNRQKGETSSWEIIDKEELSLEEAIGRHELKEIINGLTRELKKRVTENLV